MKKQFREIAAVVPMLATLAMFVPSAHAQRFSEWSEHGRKGKIFTTIDFPNAILTGANGISAHGKIVGAYDIADGTHHGFLLSDGVFAPIDFPGAISTTPIGISPRGDKIVGAYLRADGTQHGWLLSRHGFCSIDFPGSTLTFAAGVNAVGEIVGRYRSTDGKFHAYLLGSFRPRSCAAGGQVTSIDFPDATTTFGYGINAQGDVTGDYAGPDGRFHGFLWSGRQFTSIDFPASVLTFGRGINRQCEIVGRYDDADGKSHGYLLRKGHLSSIDFPDALFTSANGINSRGDIVGSYMDVDGVSHGYLRSKGDEDDGQDDCEDDEGER